MSKFKSEKVMPRYFAIAVVLTLIGFAIVGKAMYIMTAKRLRKIIGLRWPHD